MLQCSGSVWKLFNFFFYFPGNNSIFAPVNLPQSSECWNSVQYLTLPSLGSRELSGDKNLKSGMRMGLHSERFLLDHMSSRECKAQNLNCRFSLGWVFISRLSRDFPSVLNVLDDCSV